MKLEKIRVRIKELGPTDALAVSFALFLSAVNIIYSSRVQQWAILVLMNFLTIAFVFYISDLDSRKCSKWIKNAHFWYAAPLIFLSFKELYLMVHPIRMQDYDSLLMMVDKKIFGFYPTQELLKISSPFLTEIFQIAYSTFFFLPIILGINLMAKKRTREFEFAFFCIVLGFFLSYIGYLLVPAIGPRFTLHNYAKLDQELPGLWLTQFLRNFLNAGEGLSPTAVHPELFVQRDVFPSGHTQMTLISMYLSLKFKVKSGYFIIPTGILLIFATVYLRYHYVVDLIGGAFFMVLTMALGKYLFNFWMKKRGMNEFEYGKY